MTTNSVKALKEANLPFWVTPCEMKGAN